MARSHGILKTTIWEATSEFRQLTLNGQWCYAMLVSQPQINNCGAVPYVPEKWVRFANGLDRDTLNQSLLELRARLFIVVDEDTGELLVRTFIKHDRIWKQPNLITAARREYAAIESQLLREILLHQHPWLTTSTTAEAVKKTEETSKTKGLTEPLIEGVSEGLPDGVEIEGVSEGVPRARVVRAHAHPQPLPQENPPQGDSLLGSKRSAARDAPANAGAAQTNGKRPAVEIALALVKNVGSEIPVGHLDEHLRGALTTKQGDHRYDELTDDQLVELRDLHAHLAKETP